MQISHLWLQVRDPAGAATGLRQPIAWVVMPRVLSAYYRLDDSPTAASAFQEVMPATVRPQYRFGLQYFCVCVSKQGLLNPVHAHVIGYGLFVYTDIPTRWTVPYTLYTQVTTQRTASVQRSRRRTRVYRDTAALLTQDSCTVVYTVVIHTPTAQTL